MYNLKVESNLNIKYGFKNQSGPSSSIENQTLICSGSNIRLKNREKARKLKTTS